MKCENATCPLDRVPGLRFCQHHALVAELEGAISDRDRLRSRVRELIRHLPRCVKCAKVATRSVFLRIENIIENIPGDVRAYACDECASLVTTSYVTPLEYSMEVRAVMDLLDETPSIPSPTVRE